MLHVYIQGSEQPRNLKFSELTSLIEAFPCVKFQVEIRKLSFQVNHEGNSSVVLQNAVKINYLNKSLSPHLCASTEDR